MKKFVFLFTVLFCISNAQAQVSDYVHYEGSSVGIPDVSVTVSNFSENCGDITDANGAFDCTNNFSYGSLTVAAWKGIPNSSYPHSEWVDGVTTLDVIKIRKHILGIAPLDSYQLLAADANYSGSVSTLDIIKLEKLILAISLELSDYNSPWQFLPEYYCESPFYAPTFNAGVPQDIFLLQGNITPQNIATSVSYNTDSENDMGFNMIKIGDVNGSNSQASFTNDQSTNRETNSIVISNQPNIEFEKGKIVHIKVMATSEDQLIAYQAGLYVSPQYLEIIDIECGNLPGMDMGNFGLNEVSNGLIRTLWVEEDVKGVEFKDQKLMTIKAKITAPFDDLNNVVNLDRGILKTEFYNTNDAVTSSVINLTAESIFKPTSTPFITPNPFSDHTSIIFSLNNASSGTISIFNSSGRLVSKFNSDFQKGKNVYELNDIPNISNGILYFTIETNYESISGKMIKQ